MDDAERNRIVTQIQKRYEILLPYLNEQTRRVWAVAEALGQTHEINNNISVIKHYMILGLDI